MSFLDKITIVVPTKNDEESISQLFYFLYSVPKESWTKLIIVNYSESEMEKGRIEAVKKFSPRNTRIIHHEGRMKEAKFAGARIADTDWVLLTEPDIVFPKDYFRKVKEYEKYLLNHDLIYGNEISNDKLKNYQKWIGYFQSFAYGLGIIERPESNILINRDTLLSMCNFNWHRRITPASSIIKKIKDLRYRTFFAQRLIVYSQKINYNLNQNYA